MIRLAAKPQSIYFTDTIKRAFFLFAFVFVVLLITTPFLIKMVLSKNARLEKAGIRTIAEITDIDRRSVNTDDMAQRVYITYYDKSNDKHLVKLGYYTEDMHVGMTVDIIYNPNNFDEVQKAGSGSFFINYGVIFFLVAITLSFGAAAYSLRKRIKKVNDYLIEEGKPAYAEFVSVERSGFQINDFSPMVLKCRYTHENQEQYIMSSQYLRMNPSPYLEGNKVKFYYDPYDFSKYYVDIEGSMLRINEV